MGGQNTGRFIQNQQLGIAIQRFKNFNPLLHAHGQFPDKLFRIDFKPEGIAEFSNPLFVLARGAVKPFALLVPK